MRQALNNLQSTHNGFGEVNHENVFKVCDEPNPVLIKEMLKNCMEGDIRKAYKVTKIKKLLKIKVLLYHRRHFIFRQLNIYGILGMQRKILLKLFLEFAKTWKKKVTNWNL